MIPLPSGSTLKILSGIGILATVGVLLAHYTGLVRDNARFKEEVKGLTAAIEAQELTISEQRSTIDDWVSSTRDMEMDLVRLKAAEAEANAEAQRLQELFAEHDLQNLLNRRPETVLRLANGGTDRIGRMLECASGSADPECDGANPSTDDHGAAEAGTD